MKTKKAFKNVFTGIFFQIFLALAQFVVIKYYIDYLGVNINGLNVLYIQILNYFNLIEAGIGGVFLYNLYKTFADKDEETTKALIYTASVKYKKYGIIFLVFTFFFSFLIPFVFSSVQVFEGYFVYASFWVMASITSLSYFFSIPLLVFHADQRGYVVNIIKNCFKIGDCLVRIAVLFYYDSFLLLLLISFVIELSYYLIIRGLFNKRYSAYKVLTKAYYKPELFSDNKFVLIDKILILVVFQTDLIILGIFKDLATVTLYGNYILLFTFISLFFSSVFKQLTPSLGALINEESTRKIINVYNELSKINWFLTSIITITLFFSFDYIIIFWLGGQFILGQEILFLLFFNFVYISSVQVSTAFVNAKGDFKKRITGSLLESSLNIITSLALVSDYGILGVLIGTTIGHYSSNFWWIPKICYSYLNQSLAVYFKSFAKHFSILVILFSINFIFWEYVDFKVDNVGFLLIYILIILGLNFSSFFCIYSFLFSDFRKFNNRMLKLISKNLIP